MKYLKLLAVGAAVAAFAGTAAHATTLEQVQQRGQLVCGVNGPNGLTGFGVPDDQGNWTGLDVDMCRAVAAAVLGDATKVKFVPLGSKERFTALQSGEIDMLARNSTWTFSRDTDLGLDFVAVNYYDGQGFMVKKDLGVSSAKELDGATVCIQTGTTTELNLADFFKSNNITYTPVTVADDSEAQRQYEAGACDAFTTDASGLAATRATLADPSSHIVLPEIISKEPLGPVVRHGDDNWGDIVRWTHYVTVIAEEKGITQANLDDVVKASAADSTSADAEIQRMLGITEKMGEGMGLTNDWG
ncbi:MAG: amino acid ABC transporter substrate-binding protein, partial [Pseudomonadota bacterium]